MKYAFSFLQNLIVLHNYGHLFNREKESQNHLPLLLVLNKVLSIVLESTKSFSLKMGPKCSSENLVMSVKHVTDFWNI